MDPRPRIWRLLGGGLLRLKGVRLLGPVTCYGLPLVFRYADSDITLGAGVVLCSKPHYTALGVRQRTLLRTLTASARIKVGNCAGLSGAVVCAANSVEIGDNCLLGANVTIVDTDFHNLEPRNRRFADPDWARISSPVRIGENVFVGANAMILKGVEIGANTVVGAASVVTRSLPANVIAAGNPARVIGNLPPPDVP